MMIENCLLNWQLIMTEWQTLQIIVVVVDDVHAIITIIELSVYVFCLPSISYVQLYVSIYQWDVFGKLILQNIDENVDRSLIKLWIFKFGSIEDETTMCQR